MEKLSNKTAHLAVSSVVIQPFQHCLFRHLLLFPSRQQFSLNEIVIVTQQTAPESAIN